MELLIVIAPILIIGAAGYIVISIQDWITNMRFYRRRTQKELNRIRRSLGKVECVKHTLPTGEIETLGPGEIYVFGKEKVGKVVGTVNEAERLIQEARDRTVD